MAGGTVEMFAGDAVMAGFGGPTAQEDYAERALHTALAMQHRGLQAPHRGHLRRRLRLDAPATLPDRERVEDEAPALRKPGTYLEPFALWALGILRDDAALLYEADERFAALGLGWYREQTKVLLSV